MESVIEEALHFVRTIHFRDNNIFLLTREKEVNSCTGTHFIRIGIFLFIFYLIIISNSTWFIMGFYSLFNCLEAYLISTFKKEPFKEAMTILEH